MNLELKQAYRLALAWIAAIIGGIFGLGVGMNFGGNYPVPFDYAGMPGYEGAGIFGMIAGAFLASIGLLALGSWLRGYGRTKRILTLGLGIGAVEMILLHFFYNETSPLILPIVLLFIGTPALVVLLDEWMRTPDEHLRYPRPALLECGLVFAPLAILIYLLLGLVGIIG